MEPNATVSIDLPSGMSLAEGLKLFREAFDGLHRSRSNDLGGYGTYSVHGDALRKQVENLLAVDSIYENIESQIRELEKQKLISGEGA